MSIERTKMNYERIKDKIHACWIGKNIGGTIGGPYEGKQELLNITGFSSSKGEPLPNDDLDLQIIWLCAMEEVGPYSLGANEIGDYWLSYLPAPWNEYGIGKANMRSGIPAPLCGELNNEHWRHSNGAWIRSEIWACLAPGYPHVARRYALADACIDHGMGEGTAAEQFTATMESLAFFNNDIRDILNKSLEAIPENSCVARCVRIAMDGYDNGLDWKDVRNALVEDSKDLGWFMAPANVGFVVTGLLYGEGDFKKSMLIAVNCGDDTDCTAATVGAFLGILGGSAGIPQDWAEYIGDEIITISIDRTYLTASSIKTCTDLTERVLDLIPSVLTANEIPFRWTDGEDEFVPHEPPAPYKRLRTRYNTYDQFLYNESRYFIEVGNTPVMRTIVEFDKAPIVEVGEVVKAKLKFITKVKRPVNIDASIITPVGVLCNKSGARAYSDNVTREYDKYIDLEFTLTEEAASFNRVIVEAIISDRHMPILFEIPITAK